MDDELKGEGNSLNYTFRMHDPRIGRFFAVDPLFRSYPHNSPFAFSENVVINAVELEGLEKKIVTHGVKVVSEHNDDSYVQSCSDACAAKLGLPSKPIKNGKSLLRVLKADTKKSNIICLD